MTTQSGNDRRHARLLCYYGDDFTGSTDVLESLFHAGVRTVLFLKPPSEEQLQGRFSDREAFGVAGVGRSLTPEEATRELTPLFETLKRADAAVIHYKICSTFDSSPEIGNIGTAAEIGLKAFPGRYVPLVAGVPYLGRYTLFGNHFAAAGAQVHRLDRHPTMSRHPITPMKEADLRKHLAAQTDLSVGLMDILALTGTPEEARERLEMRIAAENPDLVLFDVLDEERLRTVGELIWQEASGSDEGMFVVGSSGVEYALGAYWEAKGITRPPAAASSDVSAVDALLVVSGSCSPVTEGQIGAAVHAGFAGIRVPVDQFIDPEQAAKARQRLLQEAADRLDEGRSVLLYSAEGPEDASIGQFREALTAQGYRPEDSSRLLGSVLGSLARELVLTKGLRRLVIAGGDTSGYVTRELGIEALECIAALTPGAPLCRASSEEAGLDGLELVLKGGQVGAPDFFEQAKNGR
jgi:uncharacterized protein YgbK (DUF1537 family)